MSYIKYFFLLITIPFIRLSCSQNDRQYCDKQFPEKYTGFMAQGGILDKYDNGRVYLTIVHIVNPYDWAYNQHFTGTGFSSNEADALKVLEQDSCQLKQKYFEWLEKQKQ